MKIDQAMLDQIRGRMMSPPERPSRKPYRPGDYRHAPTRACECDAPGYTGTRAGGWMVCYRCDGRIGG